MGDEANSVFFSFPISSFLFDASTLRIIHAFAYLSILGHGILFLSR